MKLPDDKTFLGGVPEGEEIVSTTTFGGYYRWDGKFPFRHYVQPRYLIATRDAIYQLAIKSDA
jgi:hypothetical protein